MKSRQWFSLWIIGGGVLVALFLLAGVLLMSRLIFPAGNHPEVPTAVMKVISASTPTGILLPGQTPIPTATATLDPAKYGGIGIGQYVQITGTEGDGLRLRSGAGTENPPLFLGFESEVFQVQDGPKDVSGMTWWFLVSPTDDTRKGWASAKYLTLIKP